jgi:outer membrane protein
MRHPFRIAALGLSLAAMPAAAETRIGVIDRQRVLEEIDEGKAATALLKKDFEDKQKQLDARKGELDRLQGEFEKQSVVMSEDAKREKGGELNRRGMELAQVYQQMQQELSKREAELFRPISEKVGGIIREIAEAEGIQLVMERGQLVYAAPALDLTNELIRKYNKRYAGTKPPQAAPPREKKPKEEPRKPPEKDPAPGRDGDKK